MVQKSGNSRKSSSVKTRTATSGKRTSKSSSKKTVRRTSRKRKAKIPAYKMIVYCALGIALCVFVYLLIDISTKTPEVQPETVSITERYEEPVKKVEKPSPAPKTPAKPAEKAAPKKIETPQSAKENSVKTQTTAKKTPEPKTSKPAPAPVVASKKIETPKTTTQQKTAEEKIKSFGFPAAQNGATLIFIFDDGGQNMAHLEKFVTLPFPITVAVLPQLSYSVSSAARVRSSGNELMLHQPMQSVNSNVNPGPGAITPEMNEEQIITTLFNNVNQIGPIAGFNNHEGSGITADAEKMAIVMKFASQEGIYFLDSRTNVETKVPYVAEQLGYSYYERNIFLDNEKTRENSLKEINKGLVIANRTGQVVMIGHVWSADYLPQLLKEIYPELVSKGYKFAFVSQGKKVR